MTVTTQDSSPPTQNSMTPLVGVLFIAVGLALAVGFIVSVVQSPALTALSADSSTGAGILAFLNAFGIIVPLLILVFALAFGRIGIGVMNRDYSSAVWGQLVLFWLMVGAIIMMLYGVLALLFPAIAPGSEGFSVPIWQWIALIVGGGVFYAGWRWIEQNKDSAFLGGDTLALRDARLAWNLLIPTLAVLILIAARPLERTFIASMTNQEFAGTAEVEFIGLQNYGQLLGFRLDNISCERDEGGACLTEEDDGVIETVFPRPRDVLPESYRDLRFREISAWQFGESEYVFSVRDRDFFRAFQNTLFFTVIAVTTELILGMIIALTVNSEFPGRGLMRAAMLVPWAIPTVVSAKLWEVMLRDNRSGVINDMLIRLNFVEESQAWLADPDLQLWSLIFVDVWKTTPFFALLLLAGLQTIPSDVYEAADVDGANPIVKFFRITLPLLRPTIAVALVFRTLDSLRAFDVFDVLLGKQVQSMATYNSQVLIENQDFGYASAVGVTIFVMILIFTVVYVRTLGVDTD